VQGFEKLEKIILFVAKMLMKKTFISLLLLCLTFCVKAAEPHSDTSYWKSKYESAIGFSQTALYNWVKGGEKTSFSSNIILNVFKVSELQTCRKTQVAIW
jgi:hypothetical protein